jgi:hypothetical protein
MGLDFYTETGQGVQYQEPDGDFWFPREPYSVVEEIEQAPKGTQAEQQSWYNETRNVLNRHFYEKVDRGRLSKPPAQEKGL